MPVPRERELADLPYAGCLQPFQGELVNEGDCDTVHFEEEEFDEAQGANTRFAECAFSSVVFIGGRFRRSRFNDVWLHTVRWMGTDLVETDWLDAEIIAGVLAGLEMFSAQLRRVTFCNCKVDSVNIRAATLRDVSFVDCVLRDVDFSGATLIDVTFPGSRLDGVRFEKSRMTRVDLRGATYLGIEAGYDALRGATISSTQLLDLAPMFAHTLGVTVEDH